jgi:hypothetical protein
MPERRLCKIDQLEAIDRIQMPAAATGTHVTIPRRQQAPPLRFGGERRKVDRP